MQVNLKQSEIEIALKNYVVQQGISLYGKEVSIAFTAGRKESGISAEINIDDADIPGFTDTNLMDNLMPPVFLLKPEIVTTNDKDPVVEEAAQAEDAAVVVVSEQEEAVVEVAAATETAKPASLFG